ncbi:MAG: HAMP domain-containing histidine kinase [Elusimicrobia bacterium]|nr:HAMP domain-containing histidine kinase [Elusimicrobiota bacterium]
MSVFRASAASKTLEAALGRFIRPSAGSALDERRTTYFAFQGLLMAVLLLIFLTHRPDASSWLPRFAFLMTFLSGSLVALRLTPAPLLATWRFQVGLFLGDAVLATVALAWAKPLAELYLIFLLIIFGAALTRSLGQSLIIATVVSFLYLAAGWRPNRGLPHDAGFWVQFMFLWVLSALLAVLSRDVARAQAFRERKLRDQVVEAERLSSLGRLSAEVAHRIKGPLTTIMVNADLLAAELSGSKKVVADLRQIQESARHCKEILKSLLDLGRIEEMDRIPMDLGRAAASAVESIEAQARKKGVRLRTEGLEGEFPMLGDPALLREAVCAVLQNALESAAKGGRVALALKRRLGALEWVAMAAGGCYVLEVSDDGHGIASDIMSRIFQPFFTTRKGGSGLGLSSALRILQKHGGSIEVESDGPGRGAVFSLILPRPT